MNDIEMRQYILDTFKGTDTVVNSENHFFFYNPDPNSPPDHMFPWVTLMTNDLNDQFSNLNRPGVFRLNIGVSKQTFRSLFGQPKRPTSADDPAENDEASGDYDFTALDALMPHPVYGRMYWVCILSPSDETLTTKVQPLLKEAYETAVSKYKR